MALSSGSGGICGFSALPCSSLTTCSNYNMTCTVPCTVCINSTRCNQPMCYPLAFTVSQVCPPYNSVATTSTVSRSTVTTTAPTTTKSSITTKAPTTTKASTTTTKAPTTTKASTTTTKTSTTTTIKASTTTKALTATKALSTTASATTASATGLIGTTTINAPCLTWNQNSVIVAGDETLGSSTSQLNGSWDLSIDSYSNIYVSDGGNNRIIKFSNGSLTGIVLTSGVGSRASQVNNPSASLIDMYENLYVSDMFNHRIMKYDNISFMSTSPPISGEVAASGSWGLYSIIGTAWGIAVDAQSTVFVSDCSMNRVMQWSRWSSSGWPVAGSSSGAAGSDSSLLSCPMGIYLDQNSALYIADRNNGRIQKWPSGSSSGITVAGANGQIDSPTDVSVDTYGIVYVLSGGGLYRFYPDSTWGTVVISFSMVSFGFKFDSIGNVYIADYGSGVVRRYTVNSTSCGYEPNGTSLKCIKERYLNGKFSFDIQIRRCCSHPREKENDLFYFKNRSHLMQFLIVSD
ncbi:unnamed protein product [Rotaria sp. Silwood2]|nr:unnamed protein product [Rotaria sp. Silwood2]CAF4376735.1 unnamed protein product [Rotaria sp. Silwood2]